MVAGVESSQDALVVEGQAHFVCEEERFGVEEDVEDEQAVVG